jgi:hypothetical protein
MGKRKDVQDQADDAVPAAGESTPTPPEASEVQAAPAETPAEAILIGPTKPDSAPIELPLVESPKLDGSEATADASPEAAAIPAPEIIAAAAAAAAPRGSSRFALLAASIAVVAAAGAFVGSLGAMGVAHLFPRNAAPVVANNNHGTALIAAEMNALKANIDAAARNASSQFAKIADRIDRAERAQVDPTAKIARIAEALDRLEKRTAAVAAPETTGSIVTPSAPAPATEPKLADRVLEGWVIHQVANGHALVESRFGNLFDIAAGGFLPGVGRVEQIKRQDGHWMVVTARGVIQGYH